jgi:hypothetical protein
MIGLIVAALAFFGGIATAWAQNSPQITLHTCSPQPICKLAFSTQPVTPGKPNEGIVTRSLADLKEVNPPDATYPLPAR